MEYKVNILKTSLLGAQNGEIKVENAKPDTNHKNRKP
jgi:hypothetical protein